MCFMEIRNVILDMGNVLLRYDPDYSLNKLCKNEEAKAIIRKEYFGGREWIETDIGSITVEERTELVKKRIPPEYHDDFKAVCENWDICMTPLDGAKEFCNYLKENGYRVYILSNASTEFYKYFPRWFSLDFFDGYVVSCDLHIIKPDVAIYKCLMNKYSLTAAECLFVDDVKANTEGAEKAGMNAFWFKGNYEEVKVLLSENRKNPKGE